MAKELTSFDDILQAFIVYSRTGSFQEAAESVSVPVGTVRQWSVAYRWPEKLDKVDIKALQPIMPKLEEWQARRFTDIEEMARSANKLVLSEEIPEDRFRAAQEFYLHHNAQEKMVDRHVSRGEATVQEAVEGLTEEQLVHLIRQLGSIDGGSGGSADD